ncbi:flavin-containing monooxygenase [Klenkia taihuensis]|uniref:Flavin-binding monooxygenase-like n=1 Tax=Klenkia taihuensis TaxID=1225127 RepID=A0A1I1H206_9ACTN|nr:NAD(P)-binding domain-containing protein [Klenkia taihuensis]GHE09445.1 monooxygenase [Klenkia taihuensis]SFC17796.1 Flavin-binding monooxygenase-like [Klenkia taihuensis]
MASSTAQRVCVVGAGAAGLEAVRVFRDAGHEVVAYERGDRAGGHWHTDYEALHLITPRDVSCFDGVPMPSSYPLFPSREQVVAYLDAFAADHGLLEHVRLGTEVTAVTSPDDGVSGWDVTTDGGTERFDAVVVANGHHWDPRLPAVAEGFTGRSLHSSQYRSVADVEGRRVLVVGAGNSGCDLAVDAANARLDVSIAMRHGQVFQPKTFFGRGRNQLPFLAKLPPWAAERVQRALVRVSVGTHADYPGLQPPVTRNLNEQLPVVNDLLLYWLQHGRITARTGVVGAHDRTVDFADGTSAEFDTVLWATGFRVSLPFLAPDQLTWSGGAPLRVGGMVVPVGTSRLYTVGLASPRGAQFPVFSAQSALAVRLLGLEGRTDRPLAELLLAAGAPTDQVDVLRPLWTQQMARATAVLDAVRPASPARTAQEVPR